MIRNLFSSSIYEASLYAPNARPIADLAEDARRLADVDREGQAWSRANYPEGYTSYGSMDRLHEFSTSFESLRRKIDPHVRKFVQSLELDIDKNALAMTSCWVNVMGTHSTHSGHLHPLSVVSGTFYVATPKGGGALKFEDPRLTSFMGRPPVKAKASARNKPFYEFKPVPGTLVLFESWMRHEVPPNRAEGERISVSFNYDWVKR